MKTRFLVCYLTLQLWFKSEVNTQFRYQVTLTKNANINQSKLSRIEE